jgi:hypothetical protein
MNNKSKIIVLVSFIIIVIGIIIINNIDSNSIIENLENQENSQNKGNEINIPKSNCISGCVISFDDCTYLNDGTSKCKWSNLYKFSKTDYNESYQESCDSCTPITNIIYNNISKDDNKNSYTISYKGNQITLKNGEYMNQGGKVKKLPRPKHLPSLNKNQTLSNADLDELSSGDEETTNSVVPNISSNTNITPSAGPSVTPSPSTNFNNNTINGKISNDDIIAALSSHIKSTFGNYLNSIVSNHMNNRNIGSNLNTSPHSNIQYTNLDSSLTNLANANSSNRIVNDNPYIQNGSCTNSQGQQMQCPKPYDYRPPLSN